MRARELSKFAFAPNIELSLRREARRKGTSPYLFNCRELQILDQLWRRNALLCHRAQTQLALVIFAHGVNLATSGNDETVRVATSDIFDIS